MLSTRGTVIIRGFLHIPLRICRNLVLLRHILRIHRLCATSFSRALLGDGVKCIELVSHRSLTIPPLTEGCANIHSAGSCHRLDAVLRLCGTHGETAAGAYSNHADFFCIYLRQSGQIINGTTNILNTLRRILQITGHAFAIPLVRSIIGQRDKSLLCKFLGIKTGSLLLYTTAWMYSDDCRILLPLLYILGIIEISCHLPWAILKMHRLCTLGHVLCRPCRHHAACTQQRTRYQTANHHFFPRFHKNSLPSN